MQKIIYDVEVFPNIILVSTKELNRENRNTWEISYRKNNLKEIRQYFKQFEDYLISFNGIHYDNCIILFLLNTKFKSRQDVLDKTKEFNDLIIKNEWWYKDKTMYKYKYHNQWTDVDLYMYWSKMLRLSKKISLKGLAVQLEYPVIQELPYAVNHVFTTDEEIENLINYNSIHDLGITELLYNTLYEEKRFNLQMTGSIKLREYIKEEYNLDCFSWDIPKIASELLLKEYCFLTNSTEKEIRNLELPFKKKLDLPKINFKLPLFKEVYTEMRKATDSYSKEILLSYNNTQLRLQFGSGGIHSVNSNEIYKTDSKNLIITSDVASLYPALIINYNLLRYKELLNIYSKVRKDRLEAKKLGDKSKDALLKLLLNSVSGQIDNSYSWMYYPEGALKLRLTGQLIVAYTIETLALKGFKVISANT